MMMGSSKPQRFFGDGGPLRVRAKWEDFSAKAGRKYHGGAKIATIGSIGLEHLLILYIVYHTNQPFTGWWQLNYFWIFHPELWGRFPI